MERRHFLGCLGSLPVATSAAAQEPPPPPPVPGAKIACKITVVKRSVQPDLVSRFGKGEPQACTAFKDGQEFTLTSPWRPPDGFCQWAWADIRTYVSANFHGGDLPTIACCTDGFRPVHFRIEKVEAKG